jgi:hypothetical protein
MLKEVQEIAENILMIIIYSPKTKAPSCMGAGQKK